MVRLLVQATSVPDQHHIFPTLTHQNCDGCYKNGTYRSSEYSYSPSGNSFGHNYFSETEQNFFIRKAKLVEERAGAGTVICLNKTKGSTLFDLRRFCSRLEPTYQKESIERRAPQYVHHQSLAFYKFDSKRLKLVFGDQKV
jgi:hypothetical protein